MTITESQRQTHTYIVPKEIQCDICKTLYTDENEMDNIYYFCKEYDETSVFAKTDINSAVCESEEIIFHICQYCVKKLIDRTLFFNDDVIKLKEEVDKVKLEYATIKQQLYEKEKSINLVKQLCKAEKLI